jgi:type IV pilus assembly protein PilF
MRPFLVPLCVSLALLSTACVQTSTTQRRADSDAGAASDPSDTEKRASVRLELASNYFSRGQYATALDELKLALAAKPDLGAAYNLRGLIYAATGEDAQAEESFARAQSLNPRDADVMHNRGWFLCQRYRYDEADRLFEQAIVVPQYRDLQRSLTAQGICQARAGRLPQAQQKLLRAYEVDPTNPGTAFALADVLFRGNEYERARFYIRRINDNEELSNAQTLWLAARIENRVGNRSAVEVFGRQLRARFPQSREAQAYDNGRFDE